MKRRGSVRGQVDTGTGLGPGVERVITADKIPNVVLKECTSILMPYLLHILHVMFKLWTNFRQWREIITCVLWNPGKPHYNISKAYRSITLLNSIAKLAMSIVAEEFSHLVEAHRLLPTTHFGGHPGWTIIDSLHLLTSKQHGAGNWSCPCSFWMWRGCSPMQLPSASSIT